MTLARRAAIALVGALALAACALPEAPGESESTGETAQAIVHGTPSDASQDAVVLVVYYDALSKDGSAGCSGTLLTPRLVLTARHCIASTDEQAACAADGTPLGGAVVNGDYEPSKVFAFSGTNRPDFISGLEQGARGAAILDDGANTLCNHDVALILLDHALPGAKIAPIRLDDGPHVGETVTLVGWGITESTNTPDVRQQRTGVQILQSGPAENLPPNEFLVGEGSCAGDSGGPALAASGAVIGSLSRGGNTSGATGADRCIGGENIYTKASSFKDLILSAYQKAGQDPWLEGQPNPLLAPLGVTCAADGDCRSNMCNPQAKVCTQDCAQAACPDGFSCQDQGGNKQCLASHDDGGGCAMSRRGGASGVMAVVAAVAAAAAVRRRRCAARS